MAQVTSMKLVGFFLLFTTCQEKANLMETSSGEKPADSPRALQQPETEISGNANGVKPTILSRIDDESRVALATSGPIPVEIVQMERGQDTWSMASKGTVNVDENSMLNLPSSMARDDIILRFPKGDPSYTALLTEKAFDDGVFLNEIQQCHFIAGALFERLLTQPGALDLLKADAGILDDLQELGLKLSAAMQQNDSLEFLPSEEMLLLVLSSYLHERQESQEKSRANTPAPSINENAKDAPSGVEEDIDDSTAEQTISQENELPAVGGLSAIEYDTSGAIAETKENASILVNMPESGEAPYFSPDDHDDQVNGDSESDQDLDAVPVDIRIEEEREISEQKNLANQAGKELSKADNKQDKQKELAKGEDKADGASHLSIQLFDQGRALENHPCEFLSPIAPTKYDYLRLDKDFLHKIRCDRIHSKSIGGFGLSLKLKLDDTKRPRKQDLFSLYALRQEREDPRMILRLTLENGAIVLLSTAPHPKKKKRFLTQKTLWKSNLVAGNTYDLRLELSEGQTRLRVNEIELPLISTNRTDLMHPTEDFLAIIGNRLGGKKPSFGKIYAVAIDFLANVGARADD